MRNAVQRGRPTNKTWRPLFINNYLNPLRVDAQIQVELGMSRSSFYRMKSSVNLPVIKVGVENPWPERLWSSVLNSRPFNSIFEFDLGVLRMLALHMKCRLELKPTQFAHILSGLQDGKFDLAFAGLCDTPERRKLANFTPHYHRGLSSNSVFFYGERPTGHCEDVSDFIRGRTIGTMTGTVHESYLNSEFSGKFLVRCYLSPATTFEALYSGRVDLVLSHEKDASAFLEKISNKKIQPLQRVSYGYKTCAAVAMGKDLLGETVSAVIEKFHAVGFIEALDERVMKHQLPFTDFSPFLRSLEAM